MIGMEIFGTKINNLSINDSLCGNPNLNGTEFVK